MNFFFDSHSVHLQGQGLSALAHALDSENLVWLANLDCSTRPRPGQTDQGLTAEQPNASHRVHGLHFTLEERQLPRPCRTGAAPVACGSSLYKDCGPLAPPACCPGACTLQSSSSSKGSSPSKASPDICITKAKGANHLGLCQGLWGRKFLKLDLPPPHLSLLCLCACAPHSGDGNEKGSYSLVRDYLLLGRRVPYLGLK